MRMKNKTLTAKNLLNNRANKYTVADIISNLQCKYMAWMEGQEWPIYMTFIDRMSDTAPRVITGNPGFADSRLNFGHWLRSQGPTIGATTNAK